MKSYHVLLAIIIFALLTTPATAQVGKFGIGAHGTMVPSAVEDDDEENDREFAFGAHARLRFSANLGLEASVEFREEEITDDITLKLYPIQFSLLYYLLPSSKLNITCYCSIIDSIAMRYFILFIIVNLTNCGYQFAVCSDIYAVVRTHLEMYRK